MKFKYSCVIDEENLYKTLVLLIEKDRKYKIENHTMQPGESLLDVSPPTLKRYAGAAGLISPRWDAGASAWVEAATEEEIAAWEAEHPAPKKPEPAPTVEELQAQITALTTSNQMLEDCIIEMAGVIYA